MNSKNASILLTLSLAGCGMSIDEQEDVAAITCSVMRETRNMDAAVRVREINQAREKLKKGPYLDGDEEIIKALKYGVCEELVLNDAGYEIKLKREVEKEETRLEEERRRTREIEMARLARERELEEARLAQQRRLEEERNNRFMSGVGFYTLECWGPVNALYYGVHFDKKLIENDRKVFLSGESMIGADKMLDLTVNADKISFSTRSRSFDWHYEFSLAANLVLNRRYVERDTGEVQGNSSLNCKFL